MMLSIASIISTSFHDLHGLRFIVISLLHSVGDCENHNRISAEGEEEKAVCAEHEEAEHKPLRWDVWEGQGKAVCSTFKRLLNLHRSALQACVRGSGSFSAFQSLPESRYPTLFLSSCTYIGLWVWAPMHQRYSHQMSQTCINLCLRVCIFQLTGLIVITLAFLACLLLLVMYKALWYDQLGCPEGFILQVSVTNTPVQHICGHYTPLIFRWEKL